MNYKKELKEHYKEIKIEAGVYSILNSLDGQQFIGSLNNLKRLNGIEFQLKMNTHTNKKLQAAWNEHGKDSFKIEIIEIVKEKEDQYVTLKELLDERQAYWIELKKPAYNEV